MNYFSKHVKKFQQGGNIDQNSLAVAIEAFQENPEIFLSAAEAAQDQNAYDFVSTLTSVLNDGDVESAQQLLSEGANAQLLVGLYQIIQESGQVSNETASYKIGGKVGYLSYLKCGGKPDCGCKKNVKKAETGTVIPEGETNLFSRIINKFRRPRVEETSAEPSLKTIGYLDKDLMIYPDKYKASNNLKNVYGILREDGSVSWQQEVEDNGMEGSGFVGYLNDQGYPRKVVKSGPNQYKRVE